MNIDWGILDRDFKREESVREEVDRYLGFLDNRDVRLSYYRTEQEQRAYLELGSKIKLPKIGA